MPWDQIIAGVVTIACTIAIEAFRRKRRYKRLGIRKPPSGEVIQ